MRTNDHYMAAIDLTGWKCVVVGAGPVGLEKIRGLLSSHADVTVIAHKAIDEVRSLAEAGVVRLVERRYDGSDLDEARLVIAATSDPGLNAKVHSEAEERRLLINVADVPALCNFILPAIVRDGPIAVAISTAGASPALAQRMKREAAGHFDHAYARLAEILEAVRPWAKEHLPTYRDRKDFFDSIVNGAPDPIEMLRAGRESEVEALVERTRLFYAETRSIGARF